MNTRKSTLIAIAAVAVIAALQPPRASAQLWTEFAHTSEPHQVADFLPPLVFPELFDDQEATLEVPMVVVLLEFTDRTHDDAGHTPQYYHDMFFGEDLPSGSPTIKEYYRQTSNGRIEIVPVFEGHGTPDDGIIGWVTAQNGDSSQDLQEKRAEAVRRADDFMFFAQADSDGDDVVTAHELILVLINPGGGGGQTHPTDPEQIEVDGGAMIVQIAVGALGEDKLAMPHAHETGHPFLGHGDLYPKCSYAWTLGDGYICESLSDDCSFPDNDSCGCPDALSPLPSDSVSGATDAFPDGDGPACGTAGALDSPTAWYEVYGNGNTFTATTCSAATQMNTQLSVYCNGCTEMTCVAGNDDDAACGSGASKSTVTWCTEPDASYLIAVHGSGGDSGDYELTVTDTGAACASSPDCGLAAAHSRHWYPYPPDWMSIMGSGTNDQDDTVVPLEPWGSIHLGFTKPNVITHDGSYKVYSVEPTRSFDQQDSEPEAYIIYDPQRPVAERYKEYFIIESRNDSELPDSGLGIWLINENWINPYPEMTPNLRRAVRLVHEAGHNPQPSAFLWDGGSPFYYDFTHDSAPRDSAWSDGTPSYVEVYDISPAGDFMTFKVRMPGLFVDDSNMSGTETGSQQYPFRLLGDGVAAITEPPRTIWIAGGHYRETPLTITTPCTVMHWKDGDATVGE